MRTSLNEIKQCDEYLQGKLNPEEHILFEAKLLISPVWRFNLHVLKQVHAVIRLYGWIQMKKELDEIHSRILHDPDKKTFCQNISNIFLKN
ncbi:MAG TPA: hypothetical protein VGK59_21135 [Ohtaekwangia sp.]